MKKKILIMGLPGAGKTTLARILVSYLKAIWLNNDEIRKEANDWCMVVAKVSLNLVNINILQEMQ